MNIAYKIIHDEFLTQDEANIAMYDLKELLKELEPGLWENSRGYYELPDWIQELMDHYDILPSDSRMQTICFKAIAQAYKNTLNSFYD